jgi:hypothetical protein
MSASDYVHLDVLLIKKETDMAFLLVLEDDERELWVPKSQVSNSDDYDEGDTDCTVSVSEWFASKEGLA